MLFPYSLLINLGAVLDLIVVQDQQQVIGFLRHTNKIIIIIIMNVFDSISCSFSLLLFLLCQFVKINNLYENEPCIFKFASIPISFLSDIQCLSFISERSCFFLSPRFLCKIQMPACLFACPPALKRDGLHPAELIVCWQTSFTELILPSFHHPITFYYNVYTFSHRS